MENKLEEEEIQNENDMDTIDNIIDNLLEVKGKKPGTFAIIKEEDIKNEQRQVC